VFPIQLGSAPSNVSGTERSIYAGHANQDAIGQPSVYVRPTTLDIEEGQKVIPPRFLVPVDVKLPDLATTQERSKDGRACNTPTFVYESRQTGIATRKDLFAEAMLENSPTRPPRRVGDFVVSAAVQFLFLAVLLFVPLYFSEAIDVHQFNKLLLVVPPRAPAPPPPLTSSQSVAPKRRSLVGDREIGWVPRVIPHQVVRLTEEPEGNDLAAAIAPGEGVAGWGSWRSAWWRDRRSPVRRCSSSSNSNRFSAEGPEFVSVEK